MGETKSGRPRVVVIGAGFGGLAVVQALRGKPVDVTVVDRTNHHLFQPLLYQVAMAGLSPADIASPIRGVLSEQENVQVLLAEVQGIHLAAKKLTTTAGEVPFDTLIVAAGARNEYFGHADWAERAKGLKTLDDALDIRRRVLLAFEKTEERHITGTPEERARPPGADLTFVVIGGGPTGVELAGAIAELARFALARDFRAIDPKAARVVLIEGGTRVLASFPQRLSDRGAAQLGELGVELRTGWRVQHIDERGVELTRESVTERIDAAIVLWGADVSASPLGADVFVIGDMALFLQDGVPLPGLSPVALQQGRFVARTIGRRMKGLAPETFRYVDKGTMATIGRSRAVAWSGPLQVSGFLAWLMWLFVHLWFLITFRNRVAVLLTWFWSYVTYKRGARLITERS
ncbi:MAG: NAD(P)/FAD-dependent oxidoreductase [Myxococcales bacterium]|nr:NAD(P)/FAD-dependent oxidoreductase [Myxococcales bacterium]